MRRGWWCSRQSRGSVQSEKTGQPIGTELTSEYFESMTFELLIRHRVQTTHGKFPLLQDTGLSTGTRGLPSRREVSDKSIVGR